MKYCFLILTLVVSIAVAQQSKVTVTGVPTGYILGPGDQFVMEIADLEELNGKVHRIDNDGTVTLPLIGRMKVAGMTLPQLEKELDQKLASQLKDPHIAITVTETLSQPVTVMGAVNTLAFIRFEGSSRSWRCCRRLVDCVPMPGTA